MYPVTATEWAFAHSQLDDAPDGSKLLYNIDRNGETRDGFQDTIAQYKSRTSFIKLGGKIYAIPKGHLDPDNNNDAELGKGTFGRVKYLLDEQNVRSTVKIELLIDKHGQEILTRDNECARLNRRGWSAGSAIRPNYRKNAKFYIQMKDMGVSLFQLLRAQVNDLSDEQRLNMGIDLCLEVFYLHARSPREAHMDLKPENCTVDAAGNIQLIDFATMEDQPESLSRCNDGTHVYKAPLNDRMSKKQCDILALKRSLFMPLTILSSKDTWTFASELDTRCRSILSPAILETFKLGPILDTSSSRRSNLNAFVRDHITALHLAAILITARFNLPVSYNKLKSDSLLCLRIVDLYLNKTSVDDIKNALFNKQSEIDNALLINRVLRLGEIPLALRQSPTRVRLINTLERMGLIQHYGKLRNRPEFCAKLHGMQPSFYQKLNRFLEAIPAESEHFDRILAFFLDKPRIRDILIQRDITEVLCSTVLDKAKQDLLTACHRHPTICHSAPEISNRLFRDYIPRILSAPELHLSTRINATKAVTAVIRANCKEPSNWLRRIARPANPEAAQFFIKAACLLADKGGADEAFDNALNLLGNSARSAAELNARLNQLKIQLGANERKHVEPLGGSASRDEQEAPKRARTHGM